MIAFLEWHGVLAGYPLSCLVYDWGLLFMHRVLWSYVIVSSFLFET